MWGRIGGRWVIPSTHLIPTLPHPPQFSFSILGGLNFGGRGEKTVGLHYFVQQNTPIFSFPPIFSHLFSIPPLFTPTKRILKEKIRENVEESKIQGVRSHMKKKIIIDWCWKASSIRLFPKNLSQAYLPRFFLLWSLLFVGFFFKCLILIIFMLHVCLMYIV